MNEKLYEVLESFEREDGSLQQINDNGEYMTDAIEKVFEEAGLFAGHGAAGLCCPPGPGSGGGGAPVRYRIYRLRGG